MVRKDLIVRLVYERDSLRRFLEENARELTRQCQNDERVNKSFVFIRGQIDCYMAQIGHIITTDAKNAEKGIIDLTVITSKLVGASYIFSLYCKEQWVAEKYPSGVLGRMQAINRLIQEISRLPI